MEENNDKIEEKAEKDLTWNSKNIEKDSIDSIVNVLKTVELNVALGKTQEYFEGIAKDMKAKYPDKTPEEIGEIYESICENEKNKAPQEEIKESTDEREN